MAATGKYLHFSTVLTPVAGLNNAYNVARVHTHDMYADQPGVQGNIDFKGVVDGIYVHVNTIAGATSVTLRVCLDADGDYPLIPDATATISTGVTTAASGCASFKFGAPLKQILGGKNLYLFIKLDAGTANLTGSCITWEE